MTWITLISLILLLCMTFALLIEKLMQFLLRSYHFKIQIKSFFDYRKIYFFSNPKSSLSLFSSTKILISSIRIRKHPEKFSFIILIDKIHIKLQSLELDLAPSLQNKIDEVFAMNLMKILDFTRKALLIKEKNISILPKKPANNENSRFSKLIMPFTILLKLVGYFLLSKFSIQITKICVSILQNTPEENNIAEFKNPYDNVVSKIKLYNSCFWCTYNLDVKIIIK